MDQPLGRAVGTAVEVVEAIETLHGNGPDDFVHLLLTLGGEMLYLGRVAKDPKEGARLVKEALESGAALAKLREIIKAQGGDESIVDDTAALFTAPVQHDVVCEQSGWIAEIGEEGPRIVGERGRSVAGDDDAIEAALDGVEVGDQPGDLYFNL